MKTKRRVKRSKPATEAQKRARERNWNKRLITSIKENTKHIMRSKTTNDAEKIALGAILDYSIIIIENWR